MTERAGVRVRLLGAFEVWVDGHRVDSEMGARTQELLAYLLVFPDSDHPRERLMTALWPEKDATKGSANLRRALFLLRRALGDNAEHLLVVTDAGLRLRHSSLTSDYAELARHTAAAESGSAAAAAVAVGLLAERGELLADRNPEWVLHEQEAWHRRVVDAGRAVLAQIALGHELLPPQDVLGLAHALLALEPTDESAHTAAIALRGAAGDRAGAAAQYRRCRDVLERELGLPPGLEVEAAYQRAMAGPPLAATAARAEGPGSFAPSVAPTARGLTATAPIAVTAARRRERRHLRAAIVVGGFLMAGFSAAWQGHSLLSAAEGTATELVNEHLVATRMERLPVEDGDPDSVDAWFRNNVNYPVRSVAGTPSGFALHGGGLCAVFGEFAATAVYHGPQDARASVFTFPEGDLRLPFARAMDNGFRGLSRGPYALVFTVQSGLVHAVVADLPLDELAELAPYLVAPDT